ncbi:MAG: hypothetical protein ISS65_08730 [Desulfobacterales bacterium]|uniref:Uncharacterized protein n=1 Tax=Candidatus Desulfatibia profunda TaxID=2841695 RepID=A0A8J6TKJ6_9BACT|nr:hypothetical protein [Candidatus Desulfatibia profunda]MBL7180275.1 hypothetical protein [Desulfobacterales bacterium]
MDEKESKIPKKDRIFTIFNTPSEMVQAKIEAHKAQCREKYGTDEGIAFVSISFLCDETLRKHPELIGIFGATRELRRIRSEEKNASNEA